MKEPWTQEVILAINLKVSKNIFWILNAIGLLRAKFIVFCSKILRSSLDNQNLLFSTLTTFEWYLCDKYTNSNCNYRQILQTKELCYYKPRTKHSGSLMITLAGLWIVETFIRFLGENFAVFCSELQKDGRWWQRFTVFIQFSALPRITAPS